MILDKGQQVPLRDWHMPSDERILEATVNSMGRITGNTYILEYQRIADSQGHVFLQPYTNRYGFAFERLGMSRENYSGNFSTQQDADAWAAEWIAQDPAHHHVYKR